MCTKCKIQPSVKYGNKSHSTWCRECINIYQNKWRKNNKERYTYPKLVESPLVYAYFDSTGRSIYVGRGTLSRAKFHKYISHWWNKDLLLVTMTCMTEWQAMEYEGKWGGRYLPIMNKDGYRHQLV